MKVSRCLLGRGSSQGHASLPRIPVALLTSRESPQGTCAGWDGYHPSSLKETLGKIHFNPAPVGPTWSAWERRLYLTAGNPYRIIPEKPTASRISRQKILFQALGNGEGHQQHTVYIFIFIFTISIHTREITCAIQSFVLFIFNMNIFSSCGTFKDTRGNTVQIFPAPRLLASLRGGSQCHSSCVSFQRESVHRQAVW